MNETMVSIMSALAGVSLGMFFFCGLWWTVQRGSCSKRPALWFLGSFVVRMGIVLAGFFLCASRWNRLLLCFAGFVAARIITIHLLTPVLERRVKLKDENHAS